MKKLFFVLTLITISGSSLAQKSLDVLQTPACIDDNTKPPLTTKERAFIDEVYGDYAQKLFYNNAQRLQFIKQILRNRVVVNYYERKNLDAITPLSQVPLVKNLNPNLQRDIAYDENTFNPLKYDFNLFSREKQATHYRIDNTQYLITILPSH